jgi:SAM-dependent methyltransferase
MDFCRTSFADETFDVVWGMESVCHASNKLHFLKEANRLLKKGGRLVIADGFATKEKYEDSEEWRMKKWLRGWGVNNLDSIQLFEQSLRECGFRNIVFHDITTNVMPSSKRLYWISFPASVFSKCGEWLGLRSSLQTENIKAAYYQHTTLKSELWRYGIFTATKYL